MKISASKEYKRINIETIYIDSKINLMNISILVDSFKFLNRFDQSISLAKWIYQELSVIKYTDYKLISSFNYPDILSSIIHMNQDKNVLTDMIQMLYDPYFNYPPRYLGYIFEEKRNYQNIKSSHFNQSELNYHIIKLLLDYGADIHVKEDVMLRYCCQKGYTDVVKLLLEYGANVHACEESSLIYSCINERIEIIRLLLDYGANIHHNNDEALSNAANYNSEKVTILLLQNGADVHGNDDKALRDACFRRREAIVKILIEYGANVNATLILETACDTHNINIIKMLLEAGAIVTDQVLAMNRISKEIRDLLTDWKLRQQQ